MSPRRKSRQPQTGARPKHARLSLAFLALLVLLALLEAKSYVLERAAGRYLNRLNEHREPWGTSWERQRKTQQAVRKIEEETAASSRLQSEAAAAAGFADLLVLLPDQGGVPLSPQKFVLLYKSLPEPLRETLITTDELSQLYLSGNWQRTSVWRRDDGMIAYLIDAQNKVVADVNLSRGLLDAAAAFGRRTPGKLAENPGFVGHIYPASRFFSALGRMPDSDRSRLFLSASVLLELPNNASLVGIAAAGGQEFAMVGFEMDGDGGAAVIAYPAEAGLVENLVWTLSNEAPDSLGSSPESGRRNPVTE